MRWLLHPEQTSLRRLLAVMALALTLSFFMTGTYRNWPYKIESDGKYYYQYLVSGVLDHDFDFANNYAQPKYPWMVMPIAHYDLSTLYTQPAPHPINTFTMGPAIFWLPFFCLVYGTLWILNHVGFGPFPLDGWDRPFQYGVMYSAVIYTLLGSLLLARLLRRHYSPGAVLPAIAITTLGTGLAYYTIFEPSMSHVYDFVSLVLVATAFVWVLEQPEAQRRLFAFAAAAGLHTLVRTQNVLTIAIFCLALTWRWAQKWWAHRDSRILLAPVFTAAAYLAFVSPLLMANAYIFGNPLTNAYGSQNFSFENLQQVISVLFSMHNGLFSHHPILLAGFTGAVVLAWKSRGNQRLLLACCVAAFAAQTILNASFVDWYGGHSFGNRRALGLLLPFSMGFAYGFENLKKRQESLPWVIAGGAILLNVRLIYVYVRYWDYNIGHNILEWIVTSHSEI